MGARAEAPANGTAALVPGFGARRCRRTGQAAPHARGSREPEIQARLRPSGLAIAGEHLHMALLRRFYACAQ